MENVTNKSEFANAKAYKIIYSRFIGFCIFIMLFCVIPNAEAQKKIIHVPMASDTPPVMDGVLSRSERWNLDQVIDRRIDITNYNCGYATPGPESNNTVTWGAQWDADYLYIACKVVDDKITANDLFEIFLGMGSKDKTGCPSNSANWPRLYNSSDFQLQRLHSDKNFTSPQDAQSMVDAATWKDGTDGYIIEVAMSWEGMQFFLTTPPPIAPGYKIMFDISSSDADVAGGTRTSVLRWNECCSDRDWTDNTNFGDLILDEYKFIDEWGDDTLGINEIKNLLSSISLSPNPSNGTDVDLNIESLQAQNLNISIMNVMSQIVSGSTQSISTGSNTIQLNTSDLSNGIYLVSISNGTSSMAKNL